MMEPSDYLQPDEAVVHEARPDLRSAIPGLVAHAILAVAAGAALVVLPPFVWPDAAPALVAWGLPTVAVLWLSASAVLVLRLRTSRYVMTDQRLYRSYGRIRFNLLQTTYDKVTDLHVAQGPLGRAFGYGSVTVATAGTGMDLPGIPDPLAAKQRLEEARTAFLRRLVAQDRRRPATGAVKQAAEAALAGTSPSLWSGSPARASLAGQLLRAGGLAMAGLAMTVAGASGNGPFLFPGIGFLLFGIVGAASAVIAYRYSRFEVLAAGVVVTTGWLSRRRVETTYGKVTDVTTTQTFLGRLLGYGDIRINTAGSAAVAVAFTGVAAPGEVKAIIDRARGAGP